MKFAYSPLLHQRHRTKIVWWSDICYLHFQLVTLTHNYKLIKCLQLVLKDYTTQHDKNKTLNIIMRLHVCWQREFACVIIFVFTFTPTMIVIKCVFVCTYRCCRSRTWGVVTDGMSSTSTLPPSRVQAGCTLLLLWMPETLHWSQEILRPRTMVRYLVEIMK